MADESKITDRHMEETPIFTGPPNNLEEDSFYDLFLRFCEYARGMRINLCYPVGVYYDSMESFLYAPSRPARLFSVDPEGLDAKRAGRYLVGYARCDYGQAGDIGRRMSDYAVCNSLLLDGPVYGIRLHDELSIRDPDRYLLQVSVPIREMPRSIRGSI